MDIYKHIVYNRHIQSIRSIIQEAQDKSNLESGKEWCFLRSQPVTEYEWVAIFEKWEDEFGGVPITEGTAICICPMRNQKGETIHCNPCPLFPLK